MRSVYSFSSRKMSSIVADLSSVMTSKVRGFQFFSCIAPDNEPRFTGQHTEKLIMFHRLSNLKVNCVSLVAHLKMNHDLFASHLEINHISVVSLPGNKSHFSCATPQNEACFRRFSPENKSHLNCTKPENEVCISCITSGNK